MSSPRSRPTLRRALAVALAAAAVLAACGGDGSGGGTSGGSGTGEGGETAGDAAADPTSTTAVPTFTLDDLDAALPTEADMPAGYTVQESCRAADDPDCSTTDPKPEVHVMADTSGFNFVAVHLTLNPDPVAAAEQVDGGRERDARLVGTFHIPVAERENGYTPGRRGEGTSEDVEIDGWTGYQLVTTSEMSHPDGSSQPGIVEARIMLSRGNAVISVQANSDTSAPTEAAADAVAERMADLVVANLG